MRPPLEAISRSLGKRGRRELVGGGVDELTAAVGPVRGYPGTCRRLGGGRCAGAAEDETLDRRPLAVLRLPAAGVVGAEDGAVHDRPCLLAGGRRRPGSSAHATVPPRRPPARWATRDAAVRRASASRSVVLPTPTGASRCAASSPSVCTSASWPSALDLAILGQMGETAGQQAVELRTHLPERSRLGDGESEEVRLDRLGRRVDDGDLHLQPAHGSRRDSYLARYLEPAASHSTNSWCRLKEAGLASIQKERMDDRADSASSSQPVGALDGQPPLPVEALQELLGGLVREREELRRMGADRSTLERNRRAIVRAQWQLSHALIARHRPGAAAA